MPSVGVSGEQKCLCLTLDYSRPGVTYPPTPMCLIYNPRFRALGGCYYIILPPPASSSPAKKAVAGISMKLFSNSGSVKIISLAVYRCIDGVCFLCGLVCTAVLQMVVLCPIGWGDGGIGGWGLGLFGSGDGRDCVVVVVVVMWW